MFWCLQEQRPLKEAITEYLRVYRCTPHATTGEKLSLLLHGPHLRTRLNLVGVPSSYFFKNPEVEIMALRRRVAKNQSASKVYTYRQQAARSAPLQSGQNVRIKQPGHVPKGTSSYSQPFTVVKCRRQGAYELDDGWVPNRERLVPFMCTPAVLSIPSQPASQQTSQPETAELQRPISKAASQAKMQSESGEFQPVSSEAADPRSLQFEIALRATKFIGSCCPTTSSSTEAFIKATAETNMTRRF